MKVAVKAVQKVRVPVALLLGRGGDECDAVAAHVGGQAGAAVGIRGGLGRHGGILGTAGRTLAQERAFQTAQVPPWPKVDKPGSANLPCFFCNDPTDERLSRPAPDATTSAIKTAFDQAKLIKSISLPISPITAVLNIGEVS